MQLLRYFKTATLESDKDYFFEVLWYTCTETVLFQDTVTLFNFAEKKLTTQPSHIIFRTKKHITGSTRILCALEDRRNL